MLLADNDANFRRVLAIALRLEGHRVAEVEDLEGACDALSRQKFSVVVVSLLLPGSEGCSATEPLWSRLVDRFTIVCSPHPEALVAAQTRLPFTLQLQKPFSPGMLTSLVWERKQGQPASL